jgi:mRNA interferase MazF
MSPFEDWDVIAVPFPYIERPIQQRRPALVVAAGLGGFLDLLWVLMMIEDQEGAGLPIASVVRTAKIATIEARAASRLGRISGQSAVRVAAILRHRLS